MASRNRCLFQNPRARVFTVLIRLLSVLITAHLINAFAEILRHMKPVESNLEIGTINSLP